MYISRVFSLFKIFLNKNTVFIESKCIFKKSILRNSNFTHRFRRCTNESKVQTITEIYSYTSMIQKIKWEKIFFVLNRFPRSIYSLPPCSVENKTSWNLSAKKIENGGQFSIQVFSVYATRGGEANHTRSASYPQFNQKHKIAAKCSFAVLP